ncbi:Arm DNA-binding domain-containing protein [Sphingomonas sp.]|uniref:Arm DNA-binding domain-containing protein n=1 Tax=Sphingomonas sp. TaxID=28214 RepID=UPI0025CCDEB2|nr:Arm DNA-binding domain-containing protein [Sphingomonas sp.]
MALKELEARYATKRSKDYKLADGGGLYLLVRPTGSKLWRMKYRFADREKLLSFGRYPDLSLAEAWRPARILERKRRPLQARPSRRRHGRGTRTGWRLSTRRMPTASWPASSAMPSRNWERWGCGRSSRRTSWR